MTRSSIRRVRALALAFTLVLLAAAASADAASTVSFRAEYIDDEEDRVPSSLSVNGSGDNDAVSLSLAGQRWTVADAGGVTVIRGCTTVSPTEASCPAADVLLVSTGAGDDRVRASVAGRYLTNVDGEAGADDLLGTGELRGGQGNDLLQGASGGSLDGGLGDDVLRGGSGDEELTGGPGHDVLAAGAGDDTLNGDGSDDATAQDDLDGGPGRDVLDWHNREVAVTVDLSGARPSGAAGEQDTLSGIEAARSGAGADTLAGSAGNDMFAPGAGDDTVDTGPGDDRVEEATAGQDASHDRLDLGLGSDTVSWAEGTLDVRVDLGDPGRDGEAGALHTLISVENAIGSQNSDDTGSNPAKGDVLIGDEGPNVLQGSGGPDRIVGGGGDDRLYGETRYADTPSQGAGDEIAICLCFPASDTLRGGAGRDMLEGGLDDDRLDGGSGDDVLRGDLDPKLREAKQTAGDIDVADYATRTASVRASTARGGGVRGEHDRYVGIEGIFGGRGPDVLKGKKGRRDVLKSGAGNDRVDTRDGRAGRADRLDCGAGKDRYRADAKDRRRRCEAG